MTDLAPEARYLQELEARSRLPRGFSLATASLKFRSVERPDAGPYPMNISLLAADGSLDDWAAVLTRNRFRGAPVILAQERLQSGPLQAVVVNTKVANVGAPGGLEASRQVAAAAADGLGIRQELVLPVSTGVIGWRLPVDVMVPVLRDLGGRVAARRGDARPVDVARAIMTTDRYPKLATRRHNDGTILGIAKGAGMIEPHMATMLAFFLTDFAVPRDSLRSLLPRVADATFNRISVDGDQSTSDMCIALASGAAGPVDEERFARLLTEVAQELAEDIVRNGEGTSHVIRFVVDGAPDDAAARRAAKAVVNSPLVKTAVFGNDPNVGRIVAALGDWACGEGLSLDPAAMRLSIGGREVFADGAFRLDAGTEAELSRYFQDAAMDPAAGGYPQHHRCVEAVALLGLGPGRAEVLGSDLSYDYVRENADYRT